MGCGPVRSTLIQRQIPLKRANPSFGSLFLRVQHIPFPAVSSGRTSGAPPGVKLPWLGDESTRVLLQKEEPGLRELGARGSGSDFLMPALGGTEHSPNQGVGYQMGCGSWTYLGMFISPGEACVVRARPPSLGNGFPRGCWPGVPVAEEKRVFRASCWGWAFRLKGSCGSQAARYWGSPGPSLLCCPADSACPESWAVRGTFWLAGPECV